MKLCHKVQSGNICVHEPHILLEILLHTLHPYFINVVKLGETTSWFPKNSILPFMESLKKKVNKILGIYYQFLRVILHVSMQVDTNGRSTTAISISVSES